MELEHTQHTHTHTREQTETQNHEHKITRQNQGIAIHIKINKQTGINKLTMERTNKTREIKKQNKQIQYKTIQKDKRRKKGMHFATGALAEHKPRPNFRQTTGIVKLLSSHASRLQATLPVRVLEESLIS